MFGHRLYQLTFHDGKRHAALPIADVVPPSVRAKMPTAVTQTAESLFLEAFREAKDHSIHIPLAASESENDRPVHFTVQDSGYVRGLVVVNFKTGKERPPGTKVSDREGVVTDFGHRATLRDGCVALYFPPSGDRAIMVALTSGKYASGARDWVHYLNAMARLDFVNSNSADDVEVTALPSYHELPTEGWLRIKIADVVGEDRFTDMAKSSVIQRIELTKLRTDQSSATREDKVHMVFEDDVKVRQAGLELLTSWTVDWWKRKNSPVVNSTSDDESSVVKIEDVLDQPLIEKTGKSSYSVKYKEPAVYVMELGQAVKYTEGDLDKVFTYPIWLTQPTRVEFIDKAVERINSIHLTLGVPELQA